MVCVLIDILFRPFVLFWSIHSATPAVMLQTQFEALSGRVAPLQSAVTKLNQFLQHVRASKVNEERSSRLNTDKLDVKLLRANDVQDQIEKLLKKWDSAQRAVEDNLLTFPAFPAPSVCSKQVAPGWALKAGAVRKLTDLAHVGGSNGGTQQCPRGTATRGFRFQACVNTQLGSLVVGQTCQRPNAGFDLGLHVPVKGACDLTSWGNGAEYLERVGGTVGGRATCPAGSVVTGWGLATCGNGALQVVLDCALFASPQYPTAVVRV
jgi:hypothetical protein